MTKAPTPTEMSKGQVTTQTTPQKSSIKQRLRTDLGRSVGVTKATQLVWLTGLRAHLPTNRNSRVIKRTQIYEPKFDECPVDRSVISFETAKVASSLGGGGSLPLKRYIQTCGWNGCTFKASIPFLLLLPLSDRLQQVEYSASSVRMLKF